MNASATEINFTTGAWKTIKEKAKKENKIIFFDAYATWCGPCKYMERNVYTNDSVAAIYNANYINVKMDMEEGEGLELANEFEITAYPTLLFFSPDGKLLHKNVGAMDATAFALLGENTIDPDHQYYTLKQKATSLSLSDELFERWAAKATDLDDEDRRSIIYNYIKKNDKDLAKNKYIASVALLHADSLSDAQLTNLYANKEKLKTIQNWDEEQINDALFRLTYVTGIHAMIANNESMIAFQSVVKKHELKRAKYAEQELKLRLAEDDGEKVAKLLEESLSMPASDISLKDVSTLFFSHSDKMESEGFSKLEKTLETYKVPSSEASKQYLYRFMQLVCDMKLDDTEGAKTYGRMVYNDKAAPADLRKSINEEFSFE